MSETPVSVCFVSLFQTCTSTRHCHTLPDHCTFRTLATCLLGLQQLDEHYKYHIFDAYNLVQVRRRVRCKQL